MRQAISPPFECMTAADQDAADSLGGTVRARDAVTDEVIAAFYEKKTL